MTGVQTCALPISKTLVAISGDEQTDGLFWNVCESVPPLSICFGAIRDRTVKPALLMEGERKSCLADGIACVGLFDHNGNAEFRNWLLLRGFRHSAKKQDCSTDENPSSKSQVIGTKHGIVTPFRISYAHSNMITQVLNASSIHNPRLPKRPVKRATLL